jgi:hypothetical protein
MAVQVMRLLVKAVVIKEGVLAPSAGMSDG